LRTGFSIGVLPRDFVNQSRFQIEILPVGGIRLPLHRHWFEHSAMGDLLGEDLALVQPNNLYRCLDKLTAHKQAMFTFLGERWKELFQADFEVLLYDLSVCPESS
jgi:hypothetical protein